MDEKQALDVINQGINLAVSNGAYKSSKDVAVLSQAIEVLAKALVGREEKSTEPPLVATEEA